MEVSELRNYGAAFSDAEASWPEEVKQRMRKRGRRAMLAHLGPLQKFRFAAAFLGEHRRARKLDLSDLRAKGMTNEVFLAQQLEYLAAFGALARVLGTERAVAVMKDVMDQSAHEPLLYCLPEPADVRAMEAEPLAVFREYMRDAPGQAKRAGCNELSITEDSDEAFQFDVHWCIWLELAERMGLPEACIPNCHADDLVFPDYFAQFGIEYKRSNTLACGGSCCDFRFEKRS